MRKAHKTRLILSSIIVLLPMVCGLALWDELPGSLLTHWGADSPGGKLFAVCGMPLLLLVLHLVCVLCTLADKKQRGQDPKALGMIFWIVPAISLLSSGIAYRVARGQGFPLEAVTPALLGVLFLCIGNYLPKFRQNRTLGIKVPWTLQNEQNWNKTHRMGGKLWVAGGLVLLFSPLLPRRAMVGVTIAVAVAMALLPLGYSYLLYRRDRQAGIEYAVPPKSKAEKRISALVAVLVAVTTVGVAVLLTTGEIAVTVEDEAFTIDATYWVDATIPFDEVDTITYREDLDPGTRTNGFGSFRLAMGMFQNEEFGTYTLYAYTKATAFAVLTAGDRTLAIGLREPAHTQALYQALRAHIEG